MARENRCCVVCAQPMSVVVVQGDVELDVCDAHGAWLDRGELERIVTRATSDARPAGRSLGERFASSAIGGAGYGVGSALASTLVRRLLG